RDEHRIDADHGVRDPESDHAAVGNAEKRRDERRDQDRELRVHQLVQQHLPSRDRTADDEVELFLRERDRRERRKDPQHDEQAEDERRGDVLGQALISPAMTASREDEREVGEADDRAEQVAHFLETPESMKETILEPSSDEEDERADHGTASPAVILRKASSRVTSPPREILHFTSSILPYAT